MTQYEMTEKLSEKCKVTLEEAKTALEASDWNMLTATHLLEREKFRRMQELSEVASMDEAAAVRFAPGASATEETTAESQGTSAGQTATVESTKNVERAKAKKHCPNKGLRNLGDHVRRLVACGNRNRFEVRKGGELVVGLPVTALVLLLLCAFWVCVPLLVIGLFAGCRYRFSGKELGREGINSALTKASDAADRISKTASQA